jgi:hypothetical protein
MTIEGALRDNTDLSVDGALLENLVRRCAQAIKQGTGSAQVFVTICLEADES